jgi:hypothetical protein
MQGFSWARELQRIIIPADGNIPGEIPIRQTALNRGMSLLLVGWHNLFRSFRFEVGGSIFVRFVALRALDIALPLRVSPLWPVRIVKERSILIPQRCFTGLASNEPTLYHPDILSSEVTETSKVSAFEQTVREERV